MGYVINLKSLAARTLLHAISMQAIQKKMVLVISVHVATQSAATP
jgi:hypothetical protein